MNIEQLRQLRHAGYTAAEALAALKSATTQGPATTGLPPPPAATAVQGPATTGLPPPPAATAVQEQVVTLPDGGKVRVRKAKAIPVQGGTLPTLQGTATATATATERPALAVGVVHAVKTTKGQYVLLAVNPTGGFRFACGAAWFGMGAVGASGKRGIPSADGESYSTPKTAFYAACRWYGALSTQGAGSVFATAPPAGANVLSGPAELPSE